MTQLNQMELVADICKAVERQQPKAEVTCRQLNEIIRAANIVVETMRVDDVMASQGMGLAAWLASHDTGISSHTMAAVMYQDGPYRGAPEKWCHPWDSADFGRCHRFLEAVPGSRDLLPKMAEVSPQWKALVEHWDELTALFQEESPTRRCPKLYARMKELIGE